MLHRRLTAFGALAAMMLFVGAPGCGGIDCAEVGCSNEISQVRWRDGVVPEAANYELCIDDVCSIAEPSEANLSADAIEPDGWQVSSVHGPADGDTATVRLVLRDDAGAEVARYEGNGRLTGECCSAVVLQVDGDSLVPEA